MYSPIAPFEKSLINTTEAYIHHASQFLAMIGKNYLEDQSDDSNANLEFDPHLSSILGRKVIGPSGFAVNLNVPNWQLEVSVDGSVRETLKLAGILKSQVFDWLQNEIRSSGLDEKKLRYIDHYEVPQHEVDLGQPFQDLNIDLVSTWLNMRANANVILTDLNEIVGIDSDIRIWPHHFDTGTYYELGDKKAIGAGWAIADTLCDNPYLYIYGWNGNGETSYETVPDLNIGRWIVTSDWQGAVVESVELSSSSDQYQEVKLFMQSVVSFFKDQLNNNL